VSAAQAGPSAHGHPCVPHAAMAAAGVRRRPRATRPSRRGRRGPRRRSGCRTRTSRAPCACRRWAPCEARRPVTRTPWAWCARATSPRATTGTPCSYMPRGRRHTACVAVWMPLARAVACARTHRTVCTRRQSLWQLHGTAVGVAPSRRCSGAGRVRLSVAGGRCDVQVSQVLHPELPRV
jgi:hypothetical protein